MAAQRLRRTSHKVVAVLSLHCGNRGNSVRAMHAKAVWPLRHILLVEEDTSAGESLRYSLEAIGYEVSVASSGQAALELVANRAPDLVLLDIVLSDLSGFEVCRRIRADRAISQPAVIFVTAKTEEADRVAGFEVGADDFVAKPYSLEELMLRIHARLPARVPVEQLRVEAAHRLPAGPSKRIVLGPLEIDGASHRVFLSNKEVHLSVQEMRLLTYLASEPGKMRLRRDLLSTVWGYHPDASSRTLDTHIKRLRDKFGPLATMIQTVHGVGYRLTPPVSRTRPQASAGRGRRRR
jgi:two-component system, OmpR family, phosphate regulon response regulator PhoB